MITIKGTDASLNPERNPWNAVEELDRLLQAVDAFRGGSSTREGLWHYAEIARRALRALRSDALLAVEGREEKKDDGASLLPADPSAPVSTETLVITETLPRWLPIESAPKDGTPILVCHWEYYADRGFLPVAVRWRPYHPNAKGKEAFRDHAGVKIERISHWMPLPSPPSEPPS